MPGSVLMMPLQAQPAAGRAAQPTTGVVSPTKPAPTDAPLPTSTTLPATVSPTATGAAPTPAATVTPSPEPSPGPDTAAPPGPTPASWPTPDLQAAGRQVRLPILMYHYVEPWPIGASRLREGLTVQPEDFAAQMAYLNQRGYVTVSLYDLIDALALGTPLPERAVVLTFDDGYGSLMDYAVPILQPYGYTGTVFVITQLMDEGFPQYLTWAEAEALYAIGWKIEPHTKTHPQLLGRGRDFQLYQMLGSVQTVEAHIGTQPRFFAYPSGLYDDLSVQLAREMNLWGAVSVEHGRIHTLESAYTLHRVRVSGRSGLAEFVAGLEGDLGR